MSRLGQATLRGLDWPVLVEAWATSARTPMGASAVRAMAPLPDRAAVKAALDACGEVLDLDRLGAALPVGAVGDIRPSTVRASKGMVLDGSELSAAGSSLEAMLHLRKALDASAEIAPVL